jgi:hypothetical protein
VQSLQILFLLIAAFAVFIILPIALVRTAALHFRPKASDRPAAGPLIPSVPIGVICGLTPLTVVVQVAK